MYMLYVRKTVKAECSSRSSCSKNSVGGVHGLSANLGGILANRPVTHEGIGAWLPLLTLRYSKCKGGGGYLFAFVCVSMPVFCHSASYFHTAFQAPTPVSSHTFPNILPSVCLGTALLFITLSICRACKTPIQEVCLSSLIKKKEALIPNPLGFTQ